MPSNDSKTHENSNAKVMHLLKIPVNPIRANQMQWLIANQPRKVEDRMVFFRWFLGGWSPYHRCFPLRVSCWNLVAKPFIPKFRRLQEALFIKCEAWPTKEAGWLLGGLKKFMSRFGMHLFWINCYKGKHVKFKLNLLKQFFNPPHNLDFVS